MPAFCPFNKIAPTKELVEIRDGRKMFVNVSAPTLPEKGTIFFIHGVGGSECIWNYQVAYFLLKGYRTVTVDLVGHGASPIEVNCGLTCCVDRKWSIFSTSKSFGICLWCPSRKGLEAFCAFDEHFKDVQEVFDKYVVQYYAVKKAPDNKGLKEQKTPVVTVVAHSYGTSLAVRLAESRAEAIQRLVLISGGAPIPLEYEWSIFQIDPVCLSLFTPCIRLGFQRLAFSKHSVSSGSNSEDEFHPSADSEERRAAFQFNAYTLWATMAGQKWPEGDRHFYGRLRVPVLLICGRHDRLVSEAEEEEALFSLRYAHLRRLSKAGHMGMLEDPNRVNEFIEEHIINPPHPLGLSKRDQSCAIDGLLNEPITSQPNCDAFLDDGGALAVMNGAEYSREKNVNCRVDAELPGIASLFRPRIHSKRWRGFKNSTFR